MSSVLTRIAHGPGLDSSLCANSHLYLLRSSLDNDLVMLREDGQAARNGGAK